MNTTKWTIRLSFWLVSVLMLAAGTNDKVLASTEAKTTTLAFRNDMRKLWEDHVTWTRLYIISAVANLPDKDATAQRLLQNQTDIGNAIKLFYGEAAGGKLTVLLKEHILIAADLIDAAKANNTAKLDNAKAQWYTNAEAISAFLNGANAKHWPLDHMQSMMRTHLDLTLEEAVAQLQGNYATSIAAYEKVHQEILEMADMLSEGIIKQFPKQFN